MLTTGTGVIDWYDRVHCPAQHRQRKKNRQISLTTEKYLHLLSFYTELEQ